ncbi:MAG: TetR/AcrR family transcriptional regulator [Gemmatimonadales bacterium]
MPRAPLQARGQRRVDAILDAAAALIEESGVGGLTVHGVAERAGTSIGSMYHFFPDLDAVITGLADRQLRSFEPVLAALGARSKAEWSRISAAEVVDALVTPILENLGEHPHVLQLIMAPRGGLQFRQRMYEMRIVGLEIIEDILAARRPALSAASRRVRAAVIAGAVEGVSMFLVRENVSRPKVALELKRAVTAYLEVVEGAR